MELGQDGVILITSHKTHLAVPETLVSQSVHICVCPSLMASIESHMLFRKYGLIIMTQAEGKNCRETRERTTFPFTEKYRVCVSVNVYVYACM